MSVLPISFPLGGDRTSGAAPSGQTGTGENTQTGGTGQTGETGGSTSAGTTETKPSDPVSAPEAAEASSAPPPSRRDTLVDLGPSRATPQSVVEAQAQSDLSEAEEIAAARAQAAAYQASARLEAIIETVATPIQVAPLDGAASQAAQTGDNPYDAAPGTEAGPARS